MKGMIILVIVVLIGYAGLTGMKQFKTNGDFEERIIHELNFVDENSMDSAKQDLVNEAKKLDIDLKPDDIHIKYETELETNMRTGGVTRAKTSYMRSVCSRANSDFLKQSCWSKMNAKSHLTFMG